MELIVFGLNHRTAPVEVREGWSLSPEEARRALDDLRDPLGSSEHLILSTCNRTEFYSHIPLDTSPPSASTTARPKDAKPPEGDPGDETATNEEGGLGTNPKNALEFYRRTTRLADSSSHADYQSSNFYLYRQEDAVRHLFRLAGGLESMILGESQIVKQIKDAFAIAQESETVGKIFRQLFPAALRVGKRVRRETGISEGCITPGQAALALAGEALGSLAGRSVLLVGSGKIASLTVRAFQSEGIADFVVVNRTLERAEALVEEMGGGRAAPWGTLGEHLVNCDLVVSSTGSVEPIVSAAEMAEVSRRRGGRPQVVVDLAVPRDFDPAIHGHPGIRLFNFDDLNGVIERNVSKRTQLVPVAEEMIHQELLSFQSRMFYLQVDPVLRHIVERFEQIRLGELQKYISQFPPEYHPLVKEMTSSLSKKLMHYPIEKLKSLRDLRGLNETEIGFLKRLFLAGH